MEFYEQWNDNDINPFVLFTQKGRIKSLNKEAQFLLGEINQSTLFELATTFASTSFGFQTTILELEYGQYKFYGITVGYENEEEIGIKLYKIPTTQIQQENLTSANLVNIYSLIDLCISTNSITNSAEFLKEFDPALPDIRLDADGFIKLLNKIYQSIDNSEKIYTKLYIRIGESLKIEKKKHPILSLEVHAEEFQINPNYVKQSAFELGAKIEITDKKVRLDIPLIMK
jgi:nitrogen-specific signal transduction histidine kinase